MPPFSHERSIVSPPHTMNPTQLDHQNGQRSTPRREQIHRNFPAKANRRHLVYRDSDAGICIERDFSTDNDLFRDVFQVRENGSGGEVFAFDYFSHQYCLFVDDEPVGSLTSTAETDGEMDCRDMYPGRLLEAHSEKAFSPCKFKINRNRFSSFPLMRLMVREYWHDQLRLGGRLAVMNASLTLVSFYRRMGFLMISESEFVHPDCGTESVSMVLPADPSLPSFFSDLFGSVEDPLSIDDVSRYCELSLGPKSRSLTPLPLCPFAPAAHQPSSPLFTQHSKRNRNDCLSMDEL